MFRLLIIAGLFILAIYYVLILPFRPRQNLNNQRTQKKRAPNSNVDINYMPDEDKKGKSKPKNFDSDDYVDYEEVK